LKAIFNEAVSTTSNVLHLRDFVQVMLDLKHHTIVKEFMDVYDTIVGEIVQVKFISIKNPADRFSFIDAIVMKLDRNIGRINDYFMNTYDMKDDSLEIAKLLKISAYCFLAELHGFNENEFYYDAFQFPKIDKKLSNKTLY
jgi:hypothetical protein